MSLRTLCLVALAACLPAFGCAEREAVASSGPEELLAELAGDAPPLVLDVRTPQEFAGGHVPGAINIPHDALAGRLAEIESGRERRVVVYCERGGRATAAEAVLRDAGFDSVAHLEGDMSAWRASGRPVERSAP